MERWQGKVAVVTGASAGIGLATAKKLVQNGVIVIGLARRVDIMKNAMKEVEGSGQFHAKQCDITNEKSVTEVFNWIKDTFKSLNILVNNAGTSVIGTIEDCAIEDLENVFKLNVFGLLYCTKQAIKLMQENQSEAHIINVNSTAGLKVPDNPNMRLNIYPASKFAVTALSETLNYELSNSKIRVTNISPGAVNTDLLAKSIEIVPNSKDAFIATLQPEDLANSILHAISAPPHVEINEITLQPKRL